MSHWDSPLGIAQRHDKKRARAAKLRKQADRLDAEADELHLRFQTWKRETEQRTAEHIAQLRNP